MGAEQVRQIDITVSAEVGAEVEAGLMADRKTLPCRFFYDAVGSELFEEICEIPEYYVTRSE